MISRVLQVITESREPISLTALSEKLDIERGALEGILEFWVRKGRLREDGRESADNCVGASGSCGTSCTGYTDCAFVAKMPKVYSPLARDNQQKIL